MQWRSNTSFHASFFHHRVMGNSYQVNGKSRPWIINLATQDILPSLCHTFILPETRYIHNVFWFTSGRKKMSHVFPMGILKGSHHVKMLAPVCREKSPSSNVSTSFPGKNHHVRMLAPVCRKKSPSSNVSTSFSKKSQCSNISTSFPKKSPSSNVNTSSSKKFIIFEC